MTAHARLVPGRKSMAGTGGRKYRDAATATHSKAPATAFSRAAVTLSRHINRLDVTGAGGGGIDDTGAGTGLPVCPDLECVSAGRQRLPISHHHGNGDGGGGDEQVAGDLQLGTRPIG